MEILIIIVLSVFFGTLMGVSLAKKTAIAEYERSRRIIIKHGEKVVQDTTIENHRLIQIMRTGLEQQEIVIEMDSEPWVWRGKE